MPARRWDDSKSGTLDGTGAATLRFSHPGYGRLEVKTINLSSTSALLASCKAYRSVVGGPLIGNRFDGTTGTFKGDGADVFWPGESIVLVWAGGTPGATVAASLSGILDLGR